MKLLLAAKLQEVLRQSILETADDGTIEYFIMMVECVLENDLLRFSSCLRAVNVWQGLVYDYSDKKVCEKLLKLSFECLKYKQARNNYLKSNDVIEMYAAMWAESFYSINNLFFYVNKYMQGEKYQKLAALYFLNGADSDDTCVNISSNHLDETDLDVLTLLIENYKIALGNEESETTMVYNLG